MSSNEIIIRGAREHNLREISLTLPKQKLIVMTGVSGSGKSSLAFDTLYAEGSGGTSNRCPRTRGNFWVNCRNRMSIM
ncbi:MAG: hypothetical protein R3C12_15010 [Planctomycetaceae bacterium]